jgi:hypothetical protein
MKRNYVKPEMQVVKINQSANILAGSPVGKVSGNADLNYGGGGSVSGRSRDYDDWDEE